MANVSERRYVFGIHGQPWYWFARTNGRSSVDRRFERPIKFESTADIKFAPIIDHENLLSTFRVLEAEGGPAPGPDGVRFSDLGRQERAAAIRRLHAATADGSWKPGPSRQVRIPKPTRGTRILRMRNVLDRVISKAVTEAITPALDQMMLDCSIGFRPARGHLDMLAELAASIESENRWVVAQDDINRAFDCVPVVPTVELFRTRVPNQRTVDLIEAILRGHQGARRQVGLDQGDAMSPLAMNLLLTEVLDRPITSAHPHTPFLRYADNLVWLCRNVSEGRHVLNEARRTLERSGLHLKDQKPANMLRLGTQVEILGFRLQRENDRVAFSIGNKGWACLSQNLAEAHDAHQPAKTAELLCEGWLRACGPAFESAERESVILDMVRKAASRMGFLEIGNTHQLLRVIQETRDRWVLLRDQTRRQLRERQQQYGFSIRESAACPRARNDRPSDGGAVTRSERNVPIASGQTPVVGDGAPATLAFSHQQQLPAKNR